MIITTTIIIIIITITKTVWLNSGDIKGETESTIVVAQDQQLVQTCWALNKVIIKQVASSWSPCTQLVQTILRKKFWRKKVRVNAGYVRNMKNLLTT